MAKQDIVQSALEIIREADKRGVTLRLLGSVGVAVHCPQYGGLHGRLRDIDFAALFSQRKKIVEMLDAFNFAINPAVALYSRNRLIMAHRKMALHIDIYFDRLEYCHTIPFKSRLYADFPTLALAELLVSKLQIIELNEKDALDVIAILREHPIGSADNEEINGNRIAALCAADWGLSRTAIFNLRRIADISLRYRSTSQKESAIVTGRMRTLIAMIDDVPKGLRWRLRNRVGDRLKRFREVFEIEEK